MTMILLQKLQKSPLTMTYLNLQLYTTFFFLFTIFIFWPCGWELVQTWRPTSTCTKHRTRDLPTCAPTWWIWVTTTANELEHKIWYQAEIFSQSSRKERLIVVISFPDIVPWIERWGFWVQYRVQLSNLEVCLFSILQECFCGRRKLAELWFAIWFTWLLWPEPFTALTHCFTWSTVCNNHELGRFILHIIPRSINHAEGVQVEPLLYWRNSSRLANAKTDRYRITAAKSVYCQNLGDETRMFLTVAGISIQTLPWTNGCIIRGAEEPDLW